jgi:hypothetical protein
MPRSAPVAAVRTALGGPGKAVPGGPLVAIECVEDPIYFGLFGALAVELRRIADVRCEGVVVRSINGSIGTTWKSAFWRSLPIGRLISSQWVRAARPWIAATAYRSLSWLDPIAEAAGALRSRSIWRGLQQDPTAFKVVIDNVAVTDLVVDSYLRLRPSPRFDPSDPFILKLLRQAHRDVRLARRYFGRRRPLLYLTSYSTYIEHGIAVRIALQEGTKVVSFGSLAQFGKELTLADWVHTPNADGYRRAFASLDDKPSRIRQAAAQLEFRLSGGIDAAMSYMRSSAYGKPADEVPDGLEDAVVVFLHDFYDSPHIYHDLVFNDFWEWVCFTIETLRSSGIAFFLKPHPNQVTLSGEALRNLQAAYPRLTFLSSGVTNTQLAKAGISCGVTMYGSVAHELAYHGIPTIACARHPHAAFDFCRTARSKSSYREFLLTPRVLPISREQMREQALEFYYMRNLHGESDDLELRERFNAWWKACEGVDVERQELVDSFDKLRDSMAFKRFAARLLASDSGPTSESVRHQARTAEPMGS